MDVSQQIEAVYRRALLLRQYAVESPVSHDLLEKAIRELYFVLEELQTSQEELQQQNQVLIATRQTVESERQRYQTLFDLAPNGYLVTDLKGKIHQINYYAAAQLFHTPQEYLIDKPLLVLIQESDRAHFQAQLANLIPGNIWEVTLNPHPDQLIPVSIAITRIREPQQQRDLQQRDLQQRDLLLWSLHDMTQRKQLEQQLQNAHDALEIKVAQRTAELVSTNLRLQQEIDERLRAEQKIRDQASLIDSAPDAIFIQDLNHCISFWSQGAEQLYGWTGSDILKNNASVLFLEDASAQLATGLTLTLEQGCWQGELDHITKAGKAITVASRWTLARNETGQLQSILVVNTDITEKKQLEAQFYQAQRTETVGSMTSSIVHDLKNIFSPILGFAQLQLVRQKNLDDHTREVWESVRSSAQRGVDLVQQITSFARGTSANPVLLHVGNLLLDISKTMQRAFLIGLTPIEVRTHISTQDLKCVIADPTQLYQVVMNLCVNARDAMPDGGTLTLAAENCLIDPACSPNDTEAQAGSYIMITVADTGSGIPPNLMERIFEPFFTTKAPGQGTGLGLASVVRIVKNHGGFIEVISELGQGTQFKVYLPAIAVSEGSISAATLGLSIHQPDSKANA
jgi:two-component system, cell cycle sensor histidine kinase and response regulator CckA